MGYWATDQREPFRAEAQRAIEMNPNDANIEQIWLSHLGSPTHYPSSAASKKRRRRLQRYSK